MSEFKGTPGPWVIDGQSNGARWNIDDSEGYAVAMSFQRPDDKGYTVRDANADLIAAAPELLEALQHVLNVKRSEEWGNYGAHVNYKKLENAITKALGLGADK